MVKKRAQNAAHYVTFAVLSCAAFPAQAQPLAGSSREDWLPVGEQQRDSSHIYYVDRLSIRGAYPWISFRQRAGRQGGDANASWTTLNVEVNCEGNVWRDTLDYNGDPTGSWIELNKLGAAKIQMFRTACSYARNLSPAQAPIAEAKPPGPKPIEAPAPRKPSLSTGSGFVVSPGRVVTNYHVIQECTTITIHQGDSASDARVVATSERDDLALLGIQTSLGSPAQLRSSVSLGEDVTVAGFPLRGILGNDLIVTSGNVNALVGLRNDPMQVQISAPVQPGNSGGPLVDRSAAVVGVVVSKLDVEKLAAYTGDMAQNVNFAIKVDMLRVFLDANRVSYRSTQRGKRIDNVEVAERARGFTVQVRCAN